MAGIHSLKHVERLGAARFTDDDAVWTHTQSVDQEVARSDRALPFDTGVARFETHDVALL